MEHTQKEISEKNEKGATMIEYALMAALIAIVCIAGVTVLGTSASTKFSQIGSGIAVN